MKKLAVFIGACLVAGCTSETHVYNSWVKKGATRNAYSNVMVVALVGDQNARLEKDIEEDMVDYLHKKGYGATSYFDAYGPSTMRKGDEHAAVADLSKNGEDAILTVCLLDTAREADYSAGNPDDYAPIEYSYNFWGYYNNRCNVVFVPTYYTMNTHYFLECNLYSAHTEDLLYSSRSESFVPSSTEELAAKYDHSILRDMIDKEVIHPR